MTSKNKPVMSASESSAVKHPEKTERMEKIDPDNTEKTDKQPMADKPVVTGLRKLPSVAPIVESANLGDLVKYEADHRYSREAITVAEGQHLPLGTLLGCVTDSGWMSAYDPAAQDGREVLVGVLLEDCDARDAPRSSVMITRYALLSEDGLVWGDLTAQQQSDARVRLTARGLFIQRGV